MTNNYENYDSEIYNTRKDDFSKKVLFEVIKISSSLLISTISIIVWNIFGIKSGDDASAVSRALILVALVCCFVFAYFVLHCICWFVIKLFDAVVSKKVLKSSKKRARKVFLSSIMPAVYHAAEESIKLNSIMLEDITSVPEEDYTQLLGYALVNLSNATKRFYAANDLLSIILPPDICKDGRRNNIYIEYLAYIGYDDLLIQLEATKTILTGYKHTVRKLIGFLSTKVKSNDYYYELLTVLKSDVEDLQAVFTQYINSVIELKNQYNLNHTK